MEHDEQKDPVGSFSKMAQRKAHGRRTAKSNKEGEEQGCFQIQHKETRGGLASFAVRRSYSPSAP